MLSVARVCSRQLRLVIDSHTAIDFFAVFVKFVFCTFDLYLNFPVFGLFFRVRHYVTGDVVYSMHTHQLIVP